MTEQFAIECKEITKRFGSVLANDRINLQVKYGEIMALLGENGSGKTTLMNMLSGIYHPDGGTISVGGKEVVINSPMDAMGLGIGMIHQHFKLVDVFSAMDNVVLGTKEKRLKPKVLKQKILDICSSVGLEIDPEKKIYDMSVSEKQTVEILKVLYRGAQILILDEPTAVLTPQETEKLFAILRKMKEQGCAIIIITHKLHEVLDISDRVTILRKGQSIETVMTAGCDEKKLTDLMVGRPVSLEIERPEVAEKNTILKVVDLTVMKTDGTMALDDISFDIKTGEILGVAGVAGSGQKELCETHHRADGREAGGDPLPQGKYRRQDAGGDHKAGNQHELRPGGPARHGAGGLHGHGGQHAAKDLQRRRRAPSSRRNGGQGAGAAAGGAAGNRDAGRGHAGASDVRRKCAEGASGPGDRGQPAGSHHRLPGARTGYQFVLHRLRSAE